MNRITKPDVAALAGVDLEYVTRLIDAGVLVPAGDGTFTQGDARRARLYLGLERAGLPFGALVEALERGELSFDFLDLPVYDRFSPLSRRSFRDVSAQESIPVELLLVVRDAMGLAQASADDQVREDELQLVPLIKLQLSKGFDRAVVEQSLRVYGDTLRRIAEAEADWWHTQILLPSLASGLNAAEMLRVQAELGEEFNTVIEQALLAIYHANQEHTWTETLIAEVEDALDRAGLRSKMATSPAICFLDLTGYTRLTEERGDQAAPDVAARLTPLVQRPAERHGGKVVKWLGDGVMFHFRNSRDGVVAARSRWFGHRASRVPGRGLLRTDREPRGEDRGAGETGPGSRDPGDRGTRRSRRRRLRADRFIPPARGIPASTPPCRGEAMIRRAYSRGPIAPRPEG